MFRASIAGPPKATLWNLCPCTIMHSTHVLYQCRGLDKRRDTDIWHPSLSLHLLPHTINKKCWCRLAPHHCPKINCSRTQPFSGRVALRSRWEIPPLVDSWREILRAASSAARRPPGHRWWRVRGRSPWPPHPAAKGSWRVQSTGSPEDKDGKNMDTDDRSKRKEWQWKEKVKIWKLRNDPWGSLRDCMAKSSPRVPLLRSSTAMDSSKQHQILKKLQISGWARANRVSLTSQLVNLSEDGFSRFFQNNGILPQRSFSLPTLAPTATYWTPTSRQRSEWRVWRSGPRPARLQRTTWWHERRTSSVGCCKFHSPADAGCWRRRTPSRLSDQATGAKKRAASGTPRTCTPAPAKRGTQTSTATSDV